MDMYGNEENHACTPYVKHSETAESDAEMDGHWQMRESGSEGVSPVSNSCSNETSQSRKLSKRKKSSQTAVVAASNNNNESSIAFRYRADRINQFADSTQQGNVDTEARMWSCFEKIFCFLKGMPVYYVRTRLKFIIICQALISTFRILPIILGKSYETVFPVFTLYITLILGWHGVNFMVPRFILFYKLGMSFSLAMDIVFFTISGWSTLDAASVSQGTAEYLQKFLTALIFVFNICGLTYGWKLRRIVKAIRKQRECDQAALATHVPDSVAHGDSRLSMLEQPSVHSVNDNGDDARESLVNGNSMLSLQQIRYSIHNNSIMNIVSSPDTASSNESKRVINVGLQSFAEMTNEDERKRKNHRSKFVNNSIVTSKYTFYNFLFVFLKLQFSRLANLYTTVVVFLCFFDFSPVSPVASLTPLLIVFTTAALKDVLEDFRRKKADRNVNFRSANITRVVESSDSSNGVIKHKENGIWNDVEVGDLILLRDGDDVPADMILLATNRDDQRCYIETANLDGETNLKIKLIPTFKRTSQQENIHSDFELKEGERRHLFQSAEGILSNFNIQVECEPPSKNLFEFSGRLTLSESSCNDFVSGSNSLKKGHCSRKKSSGSSTTPIVSNDRIDIVVEDTSVATESSNSFITPSNSTKSHIEKEIVTSLTMENLILRGCELPSSTNQKNFIIGLVVYTGEESKIALNSSKMQMKRPRIEKTLDTMFVLVLCLLFTIAVSCSLGNNNWNFKIPIITAQNKTNTDAFVNVFDVPWYILGKKKSEEDQRRDKEDSFIFLSYVILFNNLIPLSMYVTMEGVRVVHAKYIEHDLAMYDPITDTPAVVRNSNINEDLGQIEYIFSDKTGTLTQNEMIFAKCSIAGLKYNDNNASNSDDPNCEPVEATMQQPALRKGTRFNDDRLLSRMETNHQTSKQIHEFLLLLSLCNTVIPKGNNDGNADIEYDCSSPDEEALVLAAKHLGYCLVKRDGEHVYLKKYSGTIEKWEILSVLEFNSDRKRMSVICKGPDGVIRLYSKGADNIIFDLLDPDQPQGVLHVTRGHLQEYASEGLRTLTVAMRVLSLEEYERWSLLYIEANNSIANRQDKVAYTAGLIENNLTLLGATAIEDKLQVGVQDAISSLRKAGLLNKFVN